MGTSQRRGCKGTLNQPTDGAARVGARKNGPGATGCKQHLKKLGFFKGFGVLFSNQKKKSNRGNRRKGDITTEV